VATRRSAAAKYASGAASTARKKTPAKKGGSKSIPATTRKSSKEVVDAEMVLWRVFGCSNEYAGRPTPFWSVEESRGPRANDRLTLSLGDLPAELTTTLRQWRAQANGLLDQMFGGVTFEQRLRRYKDDLATVEIPEFDDPYPSWLSIRLSRPLRVKAHKGATIAWLDEPATTLQILAE